MPKNFGFRQADLQRAIRAALALGLSVRGYEIGPDGRITVHTDSPADTSDTGADAALDAWMRRNGSG